MVSVKEYLEKNKEAFSFNKVKEILESLKDLKVLIIGDTIIDEYCFVEPRGGSAKDPMQTVDYLNEEIYSGGILAIANHVSNFTNHVTMVTLLGDRNDYKQFVLENLNSKVVPRFFVKENSPTPLKRRYISNVRNENNKLFMVEDINGESINKNLESEILSFLEKELPNFDLVLVGDFGHGFINQAIVKLLEEKSNFLSVNVQTNSANLGFNFVTRYNNPSFLSMDGMELRFAVGERSEDFLSLIKKLNEMKGYNNFLVTLGKLGVAYFKNGEIIECPAFISNVTDVVGAGDAVLSITSLLQCKGINQEFIPFIANCVGGVAVNIMGNARSVTKEDILGFIDKLYNESEQSDIHKYLTGVNNTLSNIDRKNISKFVEMLLEAYNNDKTIYVFGNGGSAATASHFCGDLVMGVSHGLDKRFKVVCLNDNIPSLMAIANDMSYDAIFVEQLKNFLNPGDLVVGISGSGNSINVIKGLEYANLIGGKTVAICGFKGGKIKEIAQLAVHAETDDMEITEDAHNLVIIHCVKRILCKELDNNKVGDNRILRELTEIAND
jgi:rfaE bifunctional protein kinase chain/domain